MRKHNLFTLLLLTTLHCSHAPADPLELTFGGPGDDHFYGLSIASDGGIGLSGHYTLSNDDQQMWLLKTDYDGQMLWENTYGTSSRELGADVITTSDGGYLLAGRTYQGYSRGGHYLVKTDVSGNFQWDNDYGGPDLQTTGAVVERPGGGYIIAGGSTATDAWIDWRLTTTDAAGTELSAQSRAFNRDDTAWDIEPTSDGGYIISGRRGMWGSSPAAWIIKTDANLNDQWDTVWQGVGGWRVDAQGIAQTSDGGYVAVGNILYSRTGADSDAFIVKLDSNGDVQWQQLVGGDGRDGFNEVIEMPDGSLCVTGYRDQGGATGTDLWVLEFDAVGVAGFEYLYDGVGYDVGHNLSVLPTGSIAVVGETTSAGAGGSDGLLVLFGAVPEPGSHAATLLGIAMLCVVRRQRS